MNGGGIRGFVLGQGRPRAHRRQGQGSGAHPVEDGDAAQFNQKQSPWVWKDTYIFVEDCDKRVMTAHPIGPDLVGKGLASIKDAKGKNLCPDPEVFCKSVKKRRSGIWPSGLWSPYWWPKHGET